jgi:predicted murein hydrolase (TIGR00659 family)
MLPIPDPLLSLWHDLSHTPLLWLTVTIGVYHVADGIYRRVNGFPLLHPLVIAMGVLVPLLVFTNTSYDIYFDGAQFIHFLLGPATVALAVPLYIHVEKVKQMLLPLGGALLIGSLTGILSAVGIGWALGASDVTLRSLAPKSVTTPIAMGVTEQIGGIPSLTAVIVIVTGIIGAMLGKEVLDLLRIRDESARGFAMGLSSHGLGTARAFQMGEEPGAFSGLAMGLNGAITALLVPLLARLIGW